MVAQDCHNKKKNLTVKYKWILLQLNQVKRSRRKQTNEFIDGKMISFVDPIIHS